MSAASLDRLPADRKLDGGPAEGLMRLLVMLAAALALSTFDAAAADMPRYLPSRDVTVSYDVVVTRGWAPATVIAHITSSGDVRIDTPDRGSLIYSAGQERANWLLPNGGLYMEIPVRGSLADALRPNSGARFHKAGDAVVAGIPCTDWRVSVQHGSGTVCLTGDGVILRAEGTDSSGAGGSIVATAVSYGPQPAQMFQPPAGAQRLRLPSRLGSLLPRSPQ